MASTAFFTPALRGKDDYRQIGAAFEDLIEDVEALLRAEIQIQQNRVELLLLQQLQAHRSGAGRLGVMALGIDLQTGRITERFVVVND